MHSVVLSAPQASGVYGADTCGEGRVGFHDASAALGCFGGGCTTDADCASYGVAQCSDLGEGSTACLTVCTSDADCFEGQACSFVYDQSTTLCTWPL